MERVKAFKWSVGVLLGAVGLIAAGFMSGRDSAKSERNEQTERRSPFDRRSSDRTSPCTNFPNEPICRAARKNPDDVHFIEGCFYDPGGPCVEGGGPIVVPLACTDDPWFKQVVEVYPMRRIEGFDDVVANPKSFDVKAFHTLVGLIARENGDELPLGTPLPHEMNPAEREGLTAGVQMYNQLVEGTDEYLATRASRIEAECNALPTKANYRPMRCLPFEPCVQEETKTSDSDQLPNFQSNQACDEVTKLLQLNGIRVKPERLPECQPPPKPPPYITPPPSSTHL